MKKIGENESGGPIYEVPDNPVIRMEQERKRKARMDAELQDQRHKEASDLARSSARAAWLAVWISVAALVLSFVAIFWKQGG